MFDKKDMRGIIAFIWIISFISLWIVFEVSLPRHIIMDKLDYIEKSINDENWDEAKKAMEELKEVYTKKKPLIMTNNATEAFITFNYTFGQLEASVNNEEKDAIDYIGALRYSLDYVIKGFSGP